MEKRFIIYYQFGMIRRIKKYSDALAKKLDAKEQPYSILFE